MSIAFLSPLSVIARDSSVAAVRYAIGESSLGSVLVAASDRGICVVFLGDDDDALIAELQKNFPHAELADDDSEFRKMLKAVIHVIEHPETPFTVPLDIHGTDFQKSVWKELRKIPAGKTATYSDIAARIGKPLAVRAVATACASNQIAVLIPCHRVVGKDGGMAGYRWGVPRKKAILEKEK